ncbi:integrase catalytic region [mine drainage metagenome]|uniref:Integrase catalytic region n=1 Tax=mine drainage metagenome TaxID=410659 RepID=T1AGJ4_9ZZZZ
MLHRAEQVGPGAVLFFQALFLRRHYPPQAYRTCQGILGLLKDYTPERLNAACELAVQMQSGSYRDVQGILKTGADRKTPVSPDPLPALPTHENVRGKEYYDGRNGEEIENSTGSVCDGTGS